MKKFFKTVIVIFLAILFLGMAGAAVWFFADQSDEEVPQIITGNTLFKENLTPVFIDGKWGYIDKDFNEAIYPQFDLALSFAKNGMALVFTDNGTKFGYIDTTCRFALGPFDYVNGRAYSFSDEGYALICNENSVYFTDKNGNKSREYDDGRSFKNGYAAVKIGSKWAYLNKDLNVVTEFKFDEVRDFSKDFVAAVKLGGLWGFCDKNGDVIIDTLFEDVTDFKNGYAAVKLDNKWKYINTSGKDISSADFEMASGFSKDGLAPVLKNGKWGYTDNRGFMKINPQFLSAGEFIDSGYAVVKTHSGFAIIDTAGRFLTDDDYTSIEIYDDGYAVFSKDDMHYGIMNMNGKILCEPIYSRVCYDAIYDAVNK